MTPASMTSPSGTTPLARAHISMSPTMDTQVNYQNFFFFIKNETRNEHIRLHYSLILHIY